MSDLISRSALLKEVEKYKFGAISNDTEREYIKKTILDFIVCQPTAYDIDKVVAELEELKDYRNKNKLVVRIDVENMDEIKDKIDELSKYAESQYNKAVDDFVKAIVDRGLSANDDKYCITHYDNYLKVIKELAEQLKAGGENGC